MATAKQAFIQMVRAELDAQGSIYTDDQLKSGIAKTSRWMRDAFGEMEWTEEHVASAVTLTLETIGGVKATYNRRRRFGR